MTSYSRTNGLEFYIRFALEIGQLSPALETQINHLIAEGNLSQRDRTLLSLLQDALQDGCIQRIDLPQ